MAECELFPPTAPDIECEENNAAFITEVVIAKADQPLVLPTAIGSESETSRLLRGIALRLDEENETDPITVIKGLKAVMPFATPTYKNNPVSGAKVLDESSTAMNINGIDYRDNDALYDWWKSIGSADGSSTVTSYLIYPIVGRHMIIGNRAGTTLKGIKATWRAVSGIIDAAEVSHQIQYNADWNGNPMPKRMLYVA